MPGDRAPIRAFRDESRNRAHVAVTHPLRAEGWWLIAVILIVGWLLGFFVFHVSSFLIHILLLIAVVMIVLHFMRGRGSSV